ncbi:hypothetical protein P154DRAFT_486661 [Amniculicola lignicola CBS 123094]|uniref:F-box domain-containing protein n=1 Tax=Amniculicola lignicola CBS 123094 TaxID=1392246 RepID=A0A6A5WRN7_9PLEO|nr:hypothetical protein P154DRAFT_486661 [Amniculicola lignicola CBS 123094]
MTEVSNTDFADLANGTQGPQAQQSAGLIFNISVCGRFLLIARETLIFIYDLQCNSIKPLTSVACPRRVLALSMDASSGRNAVAALLEGRMGMVCEFRCGVNTRDERHLECIVDNPRSHVRSTTRSSIVTSRATEFESRPFFNAIDVHNNHDTISLENTDDHQAHSRNWINHAWNLHLQGALKSPLPRNTGTERCCSRTVPLETGTTTFYRHLCSEDDPPRSVAICPQRRCVAFGCSAGIELHWIDALTGQSLTRWFPLTAPSDYLYFLSPRPGFESGKKLRLISSAAHPDHRPAICRSDGHHILFIDPITGKLFLGCDAPLGGPTKLLRKILLVAPEDTQIPQLYIAAADLSWGARIVAAFGDRIILYSIPPDVLALSTTDQKADSWDVYASPPFSLEGRTNDYWLNWRDEPNKPVSVDSNNIWPISIKGIEIGTLRGVCELAIFTQPDITIWAFTHNSQAQTYQVRGFADPVDRRQRYVCYSGIVHDSSAVDQTGDVIMRDVDGSSEHIHDSYAVDQTGDVIMRDEPEESPTLDGNSSQKLIKRFPKALHVENDEWVEFLDVRGYEAWYDTNGDVWTVDTVL